MLSEGHYSAADVERFMQDARAAEREACAKIADERREWAWEWGRHEEKYAAERIAAAIRQRAESER